VAAIGDCVHRTPGFALAGEGEPLVQTLSNTPFTREGEEVRDSIRIDLELP
jgi:hypothetical protein